MSPTRRTVPSPAIPSLRPVPQTIAPCQRTRDSDAASPNSSLRLFCSPAKSASHLSATPPLTAPRPVIRSMLYCASLKDRPAWKSAVTLLLDSRTKPGWQRSSLRTHDLAVWFSQGTEAAAVTSTATTTSSLAVADTSPADVFRFLLVAPAEVGRPETSGRLQRLAKRKNGLGGAVVFLLTAGGGGGLDRTESFGESSSSTGRKDGMAAFQQLQMELLDTGLPLLPLTSVETLPVLVAAFCSQIG